MALTKFDPASISTPDPLYVKFLILIFCLLLIVQSSRIICHYFFNLLFNFKIEKRVLIAIFCRTMILNIFHYTIFVSFFSIFLFLNSTLLYAKADVFEVNGVRLDVTSSSASNARKKALIKGESKAFYSLLDRLILSSDKKRIPKFTPEKITNFVRDFEVVSEKTSTVRYLATLNFRFKADLIRNLLVELNIPFAELKSDPVLVLPVFQKINTKMFWDDPNTWRQAWQKSDNKNGLVPFVYPLGDLRDMQTIDIQSALAGKTKALSDIGEIYKSQKIAVAYAVLRENLNIASRSLDVFLSVHERGKPVSRHRLTIEGSEGEAEINLLRRAAMQCSDVVNDQWKEKNLLDLSKSNIAAVTIPINGLHHWIQITNRLNKIFLSTKLELVLMSIDEIRLNIHYVGRMNQLISALAQAGLNLIKEDGDLVLYLLE